MELAFVVSTIGRNFELRRLLESFIANLDSNDQVVVIAQGNVHQIKTTVEEFQERGLNVVFSESQVGASRGRNAGVNLVTNPNSLLVFPNDSNWFSADALDRLKGLPDSFRVGSQTVFDVYGPRFELPRGEELNKWNAWRVLEASLLIRKNIFIASGGFDEDLGTGANSPWQAGEVTEFLLRNMNDFASSFEWLPTEFRIEGIPEVSGMTSAHRRRKIRAYGRGTARVMALYGYPLFWQFAHVAAGLTIGFRTQNYALLDGCWSAFGRLEGMLGFTFGSGKLKAVMK